MLNQLSQLQKDKYYIYFSFLYFYIGAQDQYFLSEAKTAVSGTYPHKEIHRFQPNSVVYVLFWLFPES